MGTVALNVLNETQRVLPNKVKGRALTGEIKVSTSTVAALFLKMALRGQRIAMVDMVLLVFTAFPHLP